MRCSRLKKHLINMIHIVHFLWIVITYSLGVFCNTLR